MFSNDGVTITIGAKTIVDCFGQTQGAGTSNCGLGEPVEKTLWPGLKPITIEYSELTGAANIQLKWDQGSDQQGSWEVIPKSRFRPNLGLLTRKTATIDAGLTKEVLYDYSTDDSKARQLPVSQTVRALGGADSRTTSYTYNDYGQVLTLTTAAGSTVNTYDNGPPSWSGGPAVVSCLRSSVLKEPDATVVSETRLECNESGDVTKSTLLVPPVAGTNQSTATDRVTQTTYDSLGRVLSVDHLGNGSTVPDLEYSYDLAGRKISEKRQIDGTSVATTDYEYFATGLLKKQTLPDPDGTGAAPRPVVNYTYDWAGNMLTRSDPRDSSWVSTYTYDAANRLIQLQGPDPDGGGPATGLRTTTEYRLSTSGVFDHKITVTSPANVASTKTLDVLGRVTDEKVGSLSATRFTYDAAGNLTRVSSPDPDGSGQLPRVRTDSTYNVHGQATTVTSFAQSSSPALTTNTYDSAGRLTGVDGPRASDEVTYEYDAAGRITKVTQPGITIPGTSTPVNTQIRYTAAGERVWMKTPLDSDTDFVRNWTYDEMGRNVSFSDARGTTAYTYTDAGWAKTIDDPRSGVMNFSYDNYGRLTERRKGTSTDKETFSYDALGNQTQAKTYGTDGTTVSSTVTSTYDHENRLATVSVTAPSSATTTYNYSPTTGLVSSIVDPAGTTALTYDSNGMIDTLDDPITSGLADYAYDQAGRVITRSDTGAGITWSRTYEQDTGRVDTQSITKGATTLVSSDLAYDPAGNVTSRTQSVNGASDSYTYAYDPAGRMETATLSGGSTTTYRYDGGGNRYYAKVGAAAAVTTDYDAASLPVSSSDGTTYTTDALGNLTLLDRSGTSSDWAFSYDSWSRMSCAKQATSCGSGTTNISYAYDALSRITTRTKGTSTAYLYRGVSEDFAKTTGSTTTTYTYTPGGPLAQKVGSTKRIYLRDLHGDVVGMTTTAGAVKGTRTFDPWGVPRTSSGESAAVGYQGDPQDFSDTGLVDMVSRYYLPALGRFTTRDVLLGEPTDPVSLNQFVYGVNSPVTMVDPTGLGPCDPTEGRCVHSSFGSSTDPGTTVAQAEAGVPAVDEPEPVPPPPPQVLARLHVPPTAFAQMMDQLYMIKGSAESACSPIDDAGLYGDCVAGGFVDAAALRLAGVDDTGLLVGPEDQDERTWGHPGPHRNDAFPGEIRGTSGWRGGLVDTDGGGGGSPARHFLGWLALGYHHPWTARAALRAAESNRGTQQDVSSGNIAIGLGIDLRRGRINVDQMLSSMWRSLYDPSNIGGALVDVPYEGPGAL